jgi:hypothetical protein
MEQIGLGMLWLLEQGGVTLDLDEPRRHGRPREPRRVRRGLRAIRQALRTTANAS